MTRTPLLLAALLPLVASAGAPSTSPGNIDQQELRDDLQVTNLLGMNVQSDGQDVGAIEDIIFDKDGRIASVIIQREGDVDRVAGEAEQALDDAQAGAEDAWQDVTDERDRPTRESVADTSERGAAPDESDDSGMGLDPDRIGTAELGDAFAKVDWSSLSVDQQAEAVRIAGGDASLQTIEYDQTESLQASGETSGEVRASKLVGMEVNLSDEESFGEVEDVLIDARTGKASAIVVDSMEFFDKERFALPVNLESMNAEQEELTVQFTKEQIDQMEEFEMGADEAADARENEEGMQGVDEEM